MNISSITYSDDIKNIPGVNVTSCIAPCTAQDKYPTHDSKYGKGGWREVNTIAERDAIPEERRTKGMAVYVNENNTLYILKYALNNYCWYAQDKTDVANIINDAIASGGINVDLTTCVTQEQFSAAIEECISAEECDEKLVILRDYMQAWVNEHHYLTEHQSLENLATKSELEEQVNEINDNISIIEGDITNIEEDIDTIRETHTAFVEANAEELSQIKSDIIELEEAIGGGEEQSFATKDELQAVADKEDADYERVMNNITSIADNYLDKEEAELVYATKDSLNDTEAAIQETIGEYAKKEDITSTIESMNLINKRYLKGYATEFYVKDYVAAVMSGRVKPGQPLDYSAQLADLQEQIDDLTQLVNSLTRQLQDLNGELAQNVQDINGQIQDVSDEMSQNVQDLEGQIQTVTNNLSQNVTTINGQIQGLSNSIEQHVQNLEGQIQDTSEELGQQIQDLSGELEQQVQGLTEQIQDLSGESEQSVQELTEQIQDLSGELEQSVQELSERLNNLE